MGAAKVALAVICHILLAGCAPVRMQVQPRVPACRTTLPSSATVVGWIAPSDTEGQEKLLAWCEPVGPVVRNDPGAPASPQPPALTIVSWNMAVGAGSLVDLLKSVRAAPPGNDPVDVVVLIQEAYRAGGDVPAECPRGSGVARRIAPKQRPDSADIGGLARLLALHVVYVPSMRNGRSCTEEPREDRGNAILSSLPLSDVVAIELPFAQQRRVGVAAVVTHGARRLVVASVHFDTIRGHRKQAQGLSQAIATFGESQTVVVGGDFNSRFLDPGIDEMRKHFTHWPCGVGRTHSSGRRLDHIFVRWLETAMPCDTGPERYGSDHHPLIAQLPGGNGP